MPDAHLPPKPYHYMVTAKPGEHEGNGHVYICDATGKKIASIWGTPAAKLACAQGIDHAELLRKRLVAKFRRTGHVLEVSPIFPVDQDVKAAPA